MVVQENERNIFDQRAVEFELWKRLEPDRWPEVACVGPDLRSHTNVVTCSEQYYHNSMLYLVCPKVL